MIELRWLSASLILLLPATDPAHSRPGRATVTVTVGTLADGKCFARFGHAARTTPDDFAVAARRLHRRWPNAHIHLDATVDTRWECVGGAMTMLARAGFTDIRYMAQPDPTER
jgi:hypothetical protein